MMTLAAASAVKLTGDFDYGNIKIPKEDDPFIVVPDQTISVADPKWGHEVQRLGHDDWLDGHVDEKRTIMTFVPPMPEKEDRTAVYDS